jgi:hypothetical protein
MLLSGLPYRRRDASLLCVFRIHHTVKLPKPVKSDGANWQVLRAARPAIPQTEDNQNSYPCFTQ